MHRIYPVFCWARPTFLPCTHPMNKNLRLVFGLGKIDDNDVRYKNHNCAEEKYCIFPLKLFVQSYIKTTWPQQLLMSKKTFAYFWRKNNCLCWMYLEWIDSVKQFDLIRIASISFLLTCSVITHTIFNLARFYI